jgi:hypothetical protein
MSCSSSRASHNICVPGCQTSACPCPATAAFACRDFCPCPELEDNVFLSQGRLASEICLDLQAVIPLVNVTSIAFRVTLAAATFLSAQCPVTIAVALSPAVEPRVFLTLGTVTNGVFVPPTPTVVIAGGSYDLFVNGKSCGPITFAV